MVPFEGELNFRTLHFCKILFYPMKKTHSLHQLYQRAILIVLSLAIGVLGTIWLAYEYQAGRNDIKRIEAEYLAEKRMTCVTE